MSNPENTKPTAPAAPPVRKGPPVRKAGSPKAAPQGGAARALPEASAQVPGNTGDATRCVNLLVPGGPGRPLSFRETHPDELPKGTVVKTVATALSINGRHFAVGELIGGQPAELSGISGLV